MAETEIPMSQLLYCAIGTPERGAVNFNLLQKFLFEVMKVLDLENVTVAVNEEDLRKFMSEGSLRQTSLGGMEETSSVKTLVEPGRRRSYGIDSAQITHILEELTKLKSDVDELSKKVSEHKTIETKLSGGSVVSLHDVESLQERLKQAEIIVDNAEQVNTSETLYQRLQSMEDQFTNQYETLKNINNVIDDQVRSILERIAILEDQFADMRFKLSQNLATTSELEMSTKSKTSAARMSLDIIQEHPTTANDLISRLSSVQQDLDSLLETTRTLTDQQESRQMKIEAMSDQIEMLKLVKADKTNVEDVLAAKADLVQVHGKVSLDHFEFKVNELAEHLDSNVSRLDSHQETIQNEVEVLKIDMGNKLDKGEYLQVKDVFNDRIDNLEDKVKTIAKLKRASLAAGSKRRVISDVQCISCDGETMMKVENRLEEMAPPPALPVHPTIKPYLTYKLDQVRKQQAQGPTSKNLLHFEKLLREATTRPVSDKSLVNRYVGGSHTTTTAAQRVTRTGNFFDTWGPIITDINRKQSV